MGSEMCIRDSLDAAREALHGLQQPEGYDEPELLAFVCEWLDPWQGMVTEDDFWDWENNSCIDHLQTLMRMLRGWQPSPNDDTIHKDRLTRVAQLSMISLMRAQRKHDEALELSLKLIRDEPTGCLLYTSPSPRDGLLSRMPSSA